MSKRLTAKEAMQALLDGKKLTTSRWIGDNFNYIYLDKYGIIVDRLNFVHDFEGYYAYIVYEEPKPKKEMWQWRAKSLPSKNWELNEHLLTELQAEEYYRNGYYRYEKHAGPFEVEE